MKGYIKMEPIAIIAIIAFIIVAIPVGFGWFIFTLELIDYPDGFLTKKRIKNH